MTENAVKVDISFQSLLEAISSLGVAERYKIWEFLEAELFPNEDDSPEDIAEIENENFPLLTELGIPLAAECKAL
ncbi:MAG: hypothetical protein JGK24_20385 [Microcoleus sp. PH2017_29_MFU_D_A]|uniref:hypothetical protein n=1 Tax=unclassified Microcoleus TaxID=2642155 RepID=UPI001E0FE9F5|nr:MULTISPECIES: hypothetical protein [unclassified Microcoleus]MCC3422091.1 hypothetical protein [Microcoleus sp. PH2017_07_MST_O_A]MCC3433463.1 hypothetical protein [Microcoleus sp. PH2017_04_SCI_O_A]MCC3445064.1 hypothetical protein [Microcoleus sp. PH2017_03_ELD_O_A]MCC3466757.1 hypothetical protein [Microcoleus sp. PH2017_06_SFM_O_A]MCC3507378.1 hypothetical protein [Microcoleus sp. PH2017_19_SFW_U_A]MCC3511957.1 hypothetical protein [Microcoleus sp. PH2017_17_BER_D_A]TAE05612.1 MAG: hy